MTHSCEYKLRGYSWGIVERGSDKMQLTLAFKHGENF